MRYGNDINVVFAWYVTVTQAKKIKLCDHVICGKIKLCPLVLEHNNSFTMAINAFLRSCHWNILF